MVEQIYKMGKNYEYFTIFLEENTNDVSILL
jgi:hypothetical protein